MAMDTGDEDDDSVKVQSKFEIHSSRIMRDLDRKDVYQHQKEAVLEAKKYFDINPHSVALVVLPTGCGKTGVAVLSAYILSANSVLVVTPSLAVTDEIGKNFSDHENSFLVKRGFVQKKNARKYLPSTSIIKDAKEIRTSFNNDLMVVNAHKVKSKQPGTVLIEDIPKDQYDLVIVDEAHHYPADTWKLLIDHFSGSKRLFLTATPYYKGKPLTFFPDPSNSPNLEYSLPICYILEKHDAIEQGMIRRTEFIEVPAKEGDSDETIFAEIAKKIKEYLDKHDQDDPLCVPHQAMVLTQSTKFKNPANGFAEVYNVTNSKSEDHCDVYVSGKKYKSVEDRFNSHELRTIVIVGKLIEGYDNSNVSVVAIVRNVHSTVLFTQFLGRAIRKNRHGNGPDPICAAVISHERFKQRKNYELFDKIAEEDPEDENDE